MSLRVLQGVQVAHGDAREIQLPGRHQIHLHLDGVAEVSLEQPEALHRQPRHHAQQHDQPTRALEPVGRVVDARQGRETGFVEEIRHLVVYRVLLSDFLQKGVFRLGYCGMASKRFRRFGYLKYFHCGIPTLGWVRNARGLHVSNS